MDNKKLYHITVDFGKFTSASFNAIVSPSDDDSTMFCRMEQNEIMGAIGMLRIEESKNRIGLLYDILCVIMDIDTKKEVDGNYMYCCSNDLFKEIRVYIVDQEVWIKSGNEMFNS